MALPPSRRLDFSEVPVVDVSAFVTGDKSGEAATAEAIAQACGNVGFMYVKNHGVPQALLDNLMRETERFFKLPVEQRMEVALENSPEFRGYLPIKYAGEKTAGTNLQEAFIMFEDRRKGDHPLHLPNQWPTQVPGLKKAMYDYFDATAKFGKQMLPAFALALGLRRDFFDEMFSDPFFMLKLNHYPLQPPPENDLDIGVKGHSDSGGFTILWQDNVGGLELMNKSGEWVAMPPIEGTYALNIGDMMQIWSNGRFSSTPHRVINRSGLDRYSVPTFVNPNYYTMIEPLVGTPASDFVPYMSGDEQYDLYWRIYPQKNKRVREAVTA